MLKLLHANPTCCSSVALCGLKPALMASEARPATSQNCLQIQFCKLADCSGGDAETRKRIVAQQAINDIRLAAFERPYALVTELKRHARGTLGLNQIYL